MLDTDVPDEFLHRYRSVPPLVLYRQLLAGDPDHVERVAGAWDVVAGSVRGIAIDLAASLDALSGVWAGTGAQAYQERVAVLAAWARRLADDADAMRTGLTVMAGALANAQRAAEYPAIDDEESEPPIGVLGPGFGRLMPAHLRDRAEERLVEVVATLAVEYAIAEHTIWHGPRPQPAPDPDPDAAPAPATGSPSSVAGLAGGLAGVESATTPATAHGFPATAPQVPPSPGEGHGSAPRSALTTLVGAGAAQAAGAVAGHLIAPAAVETSSATPAMAMPAMLGGAVGPVSTTDSGDGGRRWRDDGTAMDPASIAWTERAGQPPPSTLGDSTGTRA